MNPKAFANLLIAGGILSTPLTGLCGRIIRGKKPEDFRTLTDDPTRLVVLLTGPDGLAGLVGKSGYEMLMEIGYEPEYAAHKVNEGCEFKLAVFPEGGPAKLATWEGVIETVSSIYPDIASTLRNALPELKALPFEEIQRRSGFRYLDVEKTGPSDPRYMTYERFRSASPTVERVREFLYFTIHLRELYSGDGYTYTSDGNGGLRKGLMEYIVPNAPLESLGDYALVDLTVSLPASASQGKSIMNAPVVAQHPSWLQLPPSFDASRVNEIYAPKYEEIAVIAKEWARQNGIKPAATDDFSIVHVTIDGQITFCNKNFELPVAGADMDSVRHCEFGYRNAKRITRRAKTLDTHRIVHVFHAFFWLDDKGNSPAPGTQILLEDMGEGKKWRVNPQVVFSTGVSYTELVADADYMLRKLKEYGRYDLTIWPYHAMLGSIGHALVPIIHELDFFHGIARSVEYDVEIKGTHSLRENYSVFRPEVLTTVGGKPMVGAQKNARFLKQLVRHDAMIFDGQAGSHCLPWSLIDAVDELLAIDRSLIKKIYVLRDCTSPVVIPPVPGLPNGLDFSPQMNKAFDDLANKGVNFVNSTDPMESWPGLNLP